VESTILKDVAGFKLEGVKITIGVEDFDKPGVYSCLKDPNVQNFLCSRQSQ